MQYAAQVCSHMCCGHGQLVCDVQQHRAKQCACCCIRLGVLACCTGRVGVHVSPALLLLGLLLLTLILSLNVQGPAATGKPAAGQLGAQQLQQLVRVFTVLSKVSYHSRLRQATACNVLLHVGDWRPGVGTPP
jgi:hypothetical protein